MNEVWDYFVQDVNAEADILHELITALFPPDVFGSPD
jgi:hypothetical protein